MLGYYRTITCATYWTLGQGRGRKEKAAFSTLLTMIEDWLHIIINKQFVGNKSNSKHWFTWFVGRKSGANWTVLYYHQSPRLHRWCIACIFYCNESWNGMYRGFSRAKIIREKLEIDIIETILSLSIALKVQARRDVSSRISTRCL